MEHQTQTDQNMVTCPRCTKSSEALIRIDSRLAEKLRSAGNVEVFPSEVCLNCFEQIAGAVAKGSILLAREKAKEQKKVTLWKSRVNLIKAARVFMTDKMFSDAAVSYEKYLKVLEIVFDVKSGELTPEHFKESARTQELTVVTSVYWDLLRIYDTSPKYGDRQKAVAQKLAEFVKFTPIYPDIIRKAEGFLKSAKNPGIVKSFLKSSGESKGKCFIATSAFGSYYASEVIELRFFRDQVLRKNYWGRNFIFYYYKFSPQLVYFLNQFPILKPIVRQVLKAFIYVYSILSKKI